MTRLAYLGSLALVALSCATLPACGQQDEAQAVIAKCSDPAPAELDACMEQVRVLNETNPSKETQELEAHLIKLQVEAREQAPLPGGQPPAADQPPADDNGVSSYDVSPPTPPVSTDLGTDSTYDAPPDVPPQEETPPSEQGDPNDVGTDDSAPSPPDQHKHKEAPPPSDTGPGANK